MKASDAVAKYMFAHQVQTCFELVGGMITHLLDSFAESRQFNIVSINHEQSAAYAASEDLMKLEALCNNARRLLICIGGGARCADSMDVTSLQRRAIAAHRLSLLSKHTGWKHVALGVLRIVSTACQCPLIVKALRSLKSSWIVQRNAVHAWHLDQNLTSSFPSLSINDLAK